MKLKVRYPSSTEVITIPSDILDPKLSDLFKFLNKDSSQIESLKVGFPPKKIDVADQGATIQSLGIRNNDQLIIELRASSLQAPNTKPDTKPNANTATKPVTQPAKLKSNVNKDSVDAFPYGTLRLFKMEDDNSCLFRSVAFSAYGSPEYFHTLRQAVANVISSQPDEYTDAILGKERSSYISWILQDQSWGGAIELKILAEHLDITIYSLDISNLRIDEFNKKDGKFVLLAYSGIHYDSIALAQEGNSSDPITLFDCDDVGNFMLEKFMELGKLLKQQHYYTDTAKFTLKCNNCGVALVGEKEAIKHAKATGHGDFGEYS